VKILANGRERPAVDGCSVAEFLRELGLDPRYVIIELNGEALERAHFETSSLTEGDRVEIVKAVAGG
jgi:sulfur carrier protein